MQIQFWAAWVHIIPLLPSFGNWHCVWGANGVLSVVFICQLLLLIDVIVSLLIFTKGFNMEVTIQIILVQS